MQELEDSDLAVSAADTKPRVREGLDVFQRASSLNNRSKQVQCEAFHRPELIGPSQHSYEAGALLWLCPFYWWRNWGRERVTSHGHTSQIWLQATLLGSYACNLDHTPSVKGNRGPEQCHHLLEDRKQYIIFPLIYFGIKTGFPFVSLCPQHLVHGTWSITFRWTQHII